MSQLVLATADLEFEERVRDAFDGELEGQLRYWRDGLADDPVPDGHRPPGHGHHRRRHRPRPLTRVGAGADAGPRHRPARDQRRDRRRAVGDAAPVGAARRRTGRDRTRRPDGRAACRDRTRDGDRRQPPIRHGPRRGRGARSGPGHRGAVPEGRRGQDDDLVEPRDRPRRGRPRRSRRRRPRSPVRRHRERALTDAGAELLRRDALRSTRSTRRHSRRTSRATRRTSTCCARRRHRSKPTISTASTSSGSWNCSSASFKYVLIDTPSGLDEATLTALEYATDLVLLSATDVPSVRSTRKEIDALRIIGKPDQQWHFVLNRADARTGLTIGAIETAVGVSVDVAIPSSRSVPVSLNNGVPILEADPRSPVSLAIAQLVHRLAPQDTPEPRDQAPQAGGCRNEARRASQAVRRRRRRAHGHRCPRGPSADAKRATRAAARSSRIRSPG